MGLIAAFFLVGCGDDGGDAADAGPRDAGPTDAGPPGPATLTEVGRAPLAPELPDPRHFDFSLDAAGRLLVVFQNGMPGSNSIYATVLDATDPTLPVITPAAPVDGSDADFSKNSPQACALAGGGHALAWLSGAMAFMRLLDADGAPVGGPVMVDGGGFNGVTDVACRPDGGFTLAGVRRAVAPALAEVVLQHFDASGAPEGELLRLTAPEGMNAVQGYASLGFDDTGNLMVAFLEVQDAPEASRILVVEVPAGGAPSAPLVVASVTGYGLERPHISVDPVSGDALVTMLDSNAVRALRVVEGTLAGTVALPGVEGVENQEAEAAPLGADRHLVAWHGAGGEARLVQVGADDDVATDLSVGTITGRAFYRTPVVARDGRAVVGFNDVMDFDASLGFVVLYDVM